MSPQQPVAFAAPVQGATVGDNAKVDNYFDNRTLVIRVDGQERTVPFLAPALPADHAIVGHEQLRAELKAALFAGRDQSLIVLPGVGKTTLAIETANDPEVQAHFPDGLLWASLGRCPDVLGELKRWAWALAVDQQILAQVHSVPQARDVVSAAIGQRRMLLVIDDVWQYEAAKIFQDLGSHCGHLFISRIPEIAIKFTAGKPTKVRELSSDEGISLLRQFIPEVVAAEPQAALELVEATGGLPLALTLLGSRLKLAAWAGDAERIKDALAAYHDEKQRQQAYQTPEGNDDPPIALAAAIELSYSHESLGYEEHRALQALSVFRPKPHGFSKDLAREVAGVDKEMLYRLSDLGLLEGIPENRYTMQRTIAEYIRGKLPAEQAQACYRRAVDHFRQEMITIEESLKADGDYAGWYRYESRAWQAAKNNWLYYLGHSGADSTTALAFLRAYFDAFWWWGCYLDFAYCDQLIKEWQQSDYAGRDGEILALVRKFQDAYPKETENRHTSAWTEVAAALEKLLQLAGLDGDPTHWPEEERRHVRGLTDIFRAEVDRFGRRDPDAAARWYQEAAGLFAGIGDRWDQAWVLYHFAELNFERGLTDTALDQLRLSLSLGVAENDPEVISLAHRVRGDIFLSLNDLERATDDYNRALFHAYRFQVEPTPPDPYTVQFYAQTAARILKKLNGLYRTQQPDALSLTAALRQFWTPARPLFDTATATPDFARMWQAGEVPALKASMFPPELPREAIATEGGRYEEQVKAVCAALRERLPGLKGSDST